MVKKFKPSSNSLNLFEQLEEPVAAPPPSTTEAPTQVQKGPPAPPPALTERSEIFCPKCGMKAAPSKKGGEFRGIFYCVGACSYGENFYFEPSGVSVSSTVDSNPQDPVRLRDAAPKKEVE